MTSKEQAIYEYLKKSHNRVLKHYNQRHSDIKKLLLDVDFSNLELSYINPDQIIKLTEHKNLNKQLENVRRSFHERFNGIVIASMAHEWMTAQK